MSFLTNLKYFLFGAFYQTKDNNISIENQLENEYLTDELYARYDAILIEKQLAILDKFKRYIIKQEEKQTGLLLTPKELAQKASIMYRNYRDAGLIDDDINLVKGIQEEFEKI